MCEQSKYFEEKQKKTTFNVPLVKPPPFTELKCRTIMHHFNTAKWKK
jgi:hypothetical protein